MKMQISVNNLIYVNPTDEAVKFSTHPLSKHAEKFLSMRTSNVYLQAKISWNG